MCPSYDYEKILPNVATDIWDDIADSALSCVGMDVRLEPVVHAGLSDFAVISFILEQTPAGDIESGFQVNRQFCMDHHLSKMKWLSDLEGRISHMSCHNEVAEVHELYQSGTMQLSLRYEDNHLLYPLNGFSIQL